MHFGQALTSEVDKDRDAGMRVEAFCAGRGLLAHSSQPRGLTAPVALHALAMTAALIVFWRILPDTNARGPIRQV